MSWRRLWPLLFLVFLVSCKTELYSRLSEREANQILAALSAHGIEAVKQPGKEDTWTVLVEKEDFVRALEVLQEEGLPREGFASLGEVFQKKGLVSSPFEDRIRFIYALSQELAETISQIDGVITARVHIVLPENDPLQKKLKPSSAAVFIKCKPSAEVPLMVSKIKKLVVHSIEGLKPEQVTVVPFVTLPLPEREAPLAKVLGIEVARDSVARVYFLLALAALGLAGTLGLAVYFVLLPRVRSRSDGDRS